MLGDETRTDSLIGQGYKMFALFPGKNEPGKVTGG
jgi:hypothetical protein